MRTSSIPTPALARTPGTSLHRQLFLVLRDQINRGSYTPTQALPTEEALCEAFGVSRITVRRALNDLEQQGFVQRLQGRGTFVRADRAPTRPPVTMSFIEGLRRVATETQVEVLEVALAEPPADIASLLELAAGEQAVHAVRLRHSGTMPLMLTEAWVPAAVGSRVTAAALKKQALYEILLAQGVKFGRVMQELTAVAADPRLASLLATDVSVPLLRLNRLLYDTRSRPIQHLTVHVAPERSRFLMDLPSSAVNTLNGGTFVHEDRTVPAPPASGAKASKRR